MIDAWNFKYSDSQLSDVDEFRASRFAHSLVSILFTITERQSIISNQELQSRAFEIQYELLNSFLQIIRNSVAGWLTVYHNDDQLRKHCFMLNSLSFLIKLLSDWQEQEYFVRLQSYRSGNELEMNSEDGIFQELIVSYQQQFDSLLNYLSEAVYVELKDPLVRYLRKR